MSTKKNKIPNPKSNPAAGMVADMITHHGLTQKTVALAMRISPGLLSDIVRGKKGISAEFALRFEKCLGLSAEWLLRTQAHYDYCVAYHGKKATITSVKSLVRV